MRARLLGLCLLLLASCSASTGLDEVPASAGETSETTGAEIASQDVFGAVEKSIVFVETPDGKSHGSGIVLPDGWILTNAHIVELHQSARIGRSDGVDLGLQPVHALDWTFDLALVGPVDDALLEPIAQGVSADLSVGSRVLLIGFPDEIEASPTPTLTEGILSRRRTTAVGDYPFLQVDATIAPGQSGGALVNSNGELIGISGLQFGQGVFGLVFASDGLLPRVERLTTSPPAEPAPAEEIFELSATVGALRTFGFLVDVDESGSVDLLATSSSDVWIDFLALGGASVVQSNRPDDPFQLSEGDTRLFVNELAAGGENLIATVEPGTYQAVVGTFSNEMSDLEITGINVLRRFADIEDGLVLPHNQIVEGLSDWTRDTDSWELTLDEGDEVTITADGIADTLVAVRRDGGFIAGSDDESRGIFGTAAQLDFVAESAGTYIVEIGTFDSSRSGYLLEATVNQ